MFPGFETGLPKVDSSNWCSQFQLAEPEYTNVMVYQIVTFFWL